MTVGSRLLIEQVVSAGDEPHPSKHMDLVMVSLLGVRERTESEYRALLGAAGFRNERVGQAITSGRGADSRRTRGRRRAPACRSSSARRP
ncbi:methyltransferase [Streptomyces sp. RP5T]|uniref:methyltransferase n=1 Tax=Streptomyces sp. RP5T TaxID=2490848 RepID=UPI000F655392|nr:hypothetical protein EHS43_17165 [Streptomyces sp. RP5T]